MAKFNQPAFEMKLKKFMEENGIREIVVAAHFEIDSMVVLQAARDGSLSPLMHQITTITNNILSAAQQEYKYTMN